MARPQYWTRLVTPPSMTTLVPVMKGHAGEATKAMALGHFVAGAEPAHRNGLERLRRRAPSYGLDHVPGAAVDKIGPGETVLTRMPLGASCWT